MTVVAPTPGPLRRQEIPADQFPPFPGQRGVIRIESFLRRDPVEWLIPMSTDCRRDPGLVTLVADSHEL